MNRRKDAAENVPASRRRVQFLAHQLAEYVVAAALIAVGFHSSGGAEISLVTSGFLLAAVNLVTSSPLGLFGILSRRAHHAGDLVIAAALIALPIVFSSRLHAAGIAISEAIAVLIVWMERSTSYAATTQRSRKRLGEGEDANPSPSAARAAGAATASLPPEAARVA
ncbi:MAG: hypothetical protein WCF24_00505, partial [Acidimicrobiales bacterium]